MRGGGTTRSSSAYLVVLVVVVQVEEASCAVAEGVAAVTLGNGPGQVQELELCVRVSGGGARSTHLAVVLRDVAELVTNAESRSVDATASPADAAWLSVVEVSHHLVGVDAHLVQLLRLADQDVLPCLVKVHGLP